MVLRQAWAAGVRVWEGLVEVLTHLLSPTSCKSGLSVFSTHQQAPGVLKQSFGCRQVGGGVPVEQPCPLSHRPHCTLKETANSCLTK